MSDRYLVIPCESEPALTVIWDKLHERVFDVIDARDAARHAEMEAAYAAEMEVRQREEALCTTEQHSPMTGAEN